jgi:hypothetical protein
MRGDRTYTHPSIFQLPFATAAVLSDPEDRVKEAARSALKAIRGKAARPSENAKLREESTASNALKTRCARGWISSRKPSEKGLERRRKPARSASDGTPTRRSRSGKAI